MKSLLIVLAICSASLPGVRADLSDEIATAIRSGNAGAIAKYFAGNVDLKILNLENIYSKAQAELLLREFFSKHTLKSFNIAHKSALKNDSQFAIGTLETTSGKFRINFVMKSAGGSSTITQFRIEPEDE
jgi:hypothetical protein